MLRSIRITDGRETKLKDPVELIDCMGTDEDVCDAARVSFNKRADSFDNFSNMKLINYLATHDHWSPFSHVMMKFRFHAPIFIARQFQKHTVGFAWNEVSRRYVSNDPTFWVPMTWRRRPDNMKQGSTNEDEVVVEKDILSAYVNEMNERAKDYKCMLRQDVCPEQARAILPQCTMTEWIWTGSVYAWARFIKLRSDPTAQEECKPYALNVKTEMCMKFPKCYEALIAQHG